MATLLLRDKLHASDLCHLTKTGTRMAYRFMKQETDGSARAAFALAQMIFWWLVQQGLIPKVQAEQMLQQAVRANEAGDDDCQLAAAKLEAVLKSIRVFQPPVEH